MSDEAKTPEAKAPDVKTVEAPVKPKRRWLRRMLLIVVPLLAIAGGLAFYLQGGRYISTDNAYVGAQKVLVTPQISGTVSAISVSEGQHVSAGTIVGRLGSTGRSTGPHLHYETRIDGEAVDPRRFLQAGSKFVARADAEQ